MTDMSLLYTMSAAGFGALVVIYVILGVLIVLAIVALGRLAVLAKRTKSLPEKKEERPAAAENKETAPAPEPQVIVAPVSEPNNCDACKTVAELRERVAYLEGRLAGLESAPGTTVVVVGGAQPEPVMAEKTLSESLAAATHSGKNKITKQSVAAYIREKYGDAAELNCRGMKTGNGKLPLSDNHYIRFANGGKACFTYVYEPDGGVVLSLVRLDAERAKAIAEKHPCVSHSTFPKNKARDWYSIIADDTFTEEEYYAIFDASIEYLKGEDVLADTTEEAPMEETTLSESLAAAHTAGKSRITKQSVAAYIRGKYGDAAEVNERGAKTGNGKLPLSDNHYIFLSNGSKACFTYVYDVPGGCVMSLVRLDAERAAELAKKQASVSHSTFPKNKAHDWYSVIADGSVSDAEYLAIFDESIAYLRGGEAEAVPMAEKTLSESLDAARQAHKTDITKEVIATYLTEKYGDRVELNRRGAKTGNGKLPLSDNHYVILADGKKVCFTYVYEPAEGVVMSLVRLDAERAAELAKKHASVSHSTFPKNKAHDWYSVIADGSVSDAEYLAIFDESIAYLSGAEETEVSIGEKTLSESLEAARHAGKSRVTKKSVVSYLSGKYGDAAELNQRGAKTSNGKLPLSDNHYITLADGKKVCFTYVYDTPEEGVMILVRLDEERAKAIAKKHASVSHSTFPKNKARDWYSVIVDGSISEEEYYAILDASISYLRSPAEEGETVIGERTLSESPEAACQAAEEAPIGEKTLRESLEEARHVGKSTVSKKSIATYLDGKYGDAAELNQRGAKTGNGKLPLSDNHYIILPDGKKVCFTYIYDTPEGGVVILARLDEARAEALARKHASISHSSFPKNKANDWYGIVADGSVPKEEYFAILDASIEYLRDGVTPVAAPAEEEVAATVAEAPAEEPALEETPAVEETPVVEGGSDVTITEEAAPSGAKAVDTIHKKAVVYYLNKNYGDSLELHWRKNLTDNGKLLVPDNHFALRGDERICFSYVYEDKEGKTTILVRLSEEEGAALRSTHEGAVTRSAFPRNKRQDWYKIIVDDSFTEGEIYTILDSSVKYVLSI